MKQFLLASTLLLAACSGAESTAVADAAEPKAEPKAEPAAAQQAAEKPAKPNITSQDLGGGFHLLLLSLIHISEPTRPY